MNRPDVDIVPLAAVQVTAVLLEPVTVAVNCWLPPGATDAEPGLSETLTALGEAVTVTAAATDFVESAELVAVTVNVPALAGAV